MPNKITQYSRVSNLVEKRNHKLDVTSKPSCLVIKIQKEKEYKIEWLVTDSKKITIQLENIFYKYKSFNVKKMKVVKSSKFSHLNGTLTLKVKIEKYKIRLAYSIQLRLNTE
mgnify:CR=1 FL=1